MPKFIAGPVPIPVPGGKQIEEFVGLAATGDDTVSVARMRAPADWSEPPQTPSFSEVTVVLAGEVLVEVGADTYRVGAGQAFLALPGEQIRYRAGSEGADYVAVCLPAFREAEAGRGEQP